jgi:hypothetical protein
MNGVFLSRSSRSDSSVCGSRPCWRYVSSAARHNLLRAAYHDVDNKDGDVTERTSTGTEVGEGLVTRRVDDQQTRDVVLEVTILHIALGHITRNTIPTNLVEHQGLLLDGVHGEEGCTDLLGNTARLAFLYVGLANLRRFSLVSRHPLGKAGRPCPAVWSCRCRRARECNKWGCASCPCSARREQPRAALHDARPPPPCAARPRAASQSSRPRLKTRHRRRRRLSPLLSPRLRNPRRTPPRTRTPPSRRAWLRLWPALLLPWLRQARLWRALLLPWLRQVRPWPPACPSLRLSRRHWLKDKGVSQEYGISRERTYLS